MRARFLLAESYRQRARQHGEKAKSPIEKERKIRVTKQTEDLEAALKLLKLAIGQFQNRQLAELTNVDRMTLRNARFALAATLFELKRYEESVRAYAMVVNLYSLF